MALLIAEELANEKLAEIGPDFSHGNLSPDENAELNLNFSEIFTEAGITTSSILDEFLQQLPSLWINSVDGQVMRLAKSLAIPRREYLSDEDFFHQRESHYEFVDTFYWLIDVEKQRAKQQEYVDAPGPNVIVSGLAAHNGAEVLKPFHGWALCTLESDFPSDSALRKLSRLFPEAREKSKQVVQKILEMTEDKNLSKAVVKSRFPELSWRRFEHFWRLAAEKRPEISRPGRKS